MDVLDEVPETHPIVQHLAKRGAIVNYDEREAFELKRKLDCTTAHGGTVHVTICPTLACTSSARIASRPIAQAR